LLHHLHHQLQYLENKLLLDFLEEDLRVVYFLFHLLHLDKFLLPQIHQVNQLIHLDLDQMLHLQLMLLFQKLNQYLYLHHNLCLLLHLLLL
jgi:hypothetical protein